VDVRTVLTALALRHEIASHSREWVVTRKPTMRKGVTYTWVADLASRRGGGRGITPEILQGHSVPLATGMENNEVSVAEHWVRQSGFVAKKNSRLATN